MPSFIDPTVEENRLQDLYSYQILDTSAEKDFDELVELASAIAGTPISLISLIDKERQWFKANKGLEPIRQTSREMAFCAHAIEKDDPVTIITDARLDDRFSGNPLVTNDPNIRFYAGFPLVTDRGYKLGTLCVINSLPQTLTEGQIDKLSKVARQAMKLIELHRTNQELNKWKEAEITQRRKLQYLLNNLRKILAILAHDTRAPLYSIKQLLSLFLEGDVSEANAGKLYTMMFEQTGVTIEMIENLVKWGEMHIQSEQNELSITILEEVVSDVFIQFVPVAKEKAITLVNQVAETVKISLNETMVSFVVRNLVNNAIKYTDGGTVTISGKKMGERYILSVADTGIGMSETTRKSLFLGNIPSAQGTRKEKGSGLGLMLINDFIQQAGGSIEVESELHKGTTIYVNLPCL